MAFILSTCKNHVRTIKFNRPGQKNALNLDMYLEIKNILNKDAVDDDIAVTIFTGAGDFFSSGNDLKALMEPKSHDVDGGLEMFSQMVESFINYPKVLIAVVNGPAIGVGATIPALCDIIYASNKAYFDTPFIKLGLCIEGGSSFTFPHNLGRSKASEMIYLNHRLSADEAHHFGLISEVVPHSQLELFIEKLHRHGNLPIKGIIVNKKLIMANYKAVLSESGRRESKALYDCVTSSEFFDQVVAFISRKSKL